MTFEGRFDVNRSALTFGGVDERRRASFDVN